MKTRLYDINQEKFISRIYSNGYKVDGNPSELPEGIVELEIIIQEPLEFNSETQRLEKLEPVINLVEKTYTEGWQVIDLTAYEIAMQDWESPEYAVRIVADADMATDEFGIAMYTHFNIRQLPIIPKGDVVHLYCHEIQAKFQDAVDFYVSEGKVTIENRPTE